MKEGLARGTWITFALIAALGCSGPFLIFPGGELGGTVVTEPVEDWSFANGAFLELETRPANPYSVQLNSIVKDGKLYIDPAEERTWFAYLRADPNVRVRIDGQIYPVTAVLAGKPGELEGFDPERYVYRLDSR